MAKDQLNYSDDDDEIIEIPDLDEQSTEPSESGLADDNPDLALDDQQQTSPKTTTTEVTREKVIEKTVSKPAKGNRSNDSGDRTEKRTKQQPAETKESSKLESDNKSESRFKRFAAWFKAKKKISIPLTVALVIAILMSIPLTRYNVLGLVLRKSVTIVVVDNKTNKPVSEATVTIDGKSNNSNGNGVAELSGVRVGSKKVHISKKYYADNEANLTIKVTGQNKSEYKLSATGRQVPIKVVNSINDKPVKGASIKAGDSQALTDDSGQATLVLSPDSTTEKAKLSSEKYNSTDVEVAVTDATVPENSFKLTPAGKVYFLSKKSGKIDVVKTNLDGTDRETVLAGTGNEDEFSTTLLASRDWKYLALHAKRDNQYKLFLIETSTDTLITMDEGDATFSPAGWYNQNFIFTVTRNNIKHWQAKQIALKSYNAETKKLRTIDENRAEGSSDIDYASENFGQIYIIENELVYSKQWTADYYSGGKIVGKKNSINSIRPDGSDKKTIREFEARPQGNSYINSKLYAPSEIYFQVVDYAQNVFYEYEEGKLEEDSKVTAEEFNGYYPTFLISPSATKTFWHEPRDGKNTLFLGDKNAGNPQEIATLSVYQPFGWFGDEYLLESKNGSELYIATPQTVDAPIKISDYHKPSNSFAGYGYGYGGL